jgi:hypothetical protein
MAPQLPAAFQKSSEAFLDDAVDELFLNENPDESESIMDFVNVWNPANDVPLDTDAQLGYLLDRLLED